MHISSSEYSSRFSPAREYRGFVDHVWIDDKHFHVWASQNGELINIGGLLVYTHTRLRAETAKPTERVSRLVLISVLINIVFA